MSGCRMSGDVSATSFSDLDFARSNRRLLTQGLLDSSLLLVYTLFGALVFWGLEKKFDDELMELYKWRCVKERQVILDRIDNACNTSTFAQCRTMVREGVEKMDWCLRTWNVSKPTLSLSNFFNAIAFSISAYTTIGYGTVSTETASARIFCLFYIFFGLPLFLNLIRDFATLLRRANFWLWTRYSLIWRGGPLTLGDYPHNHRDMRLWETRRSAPTALFILFLYIFFVSAILTAVITDFNYFETFYFVAQSATLVGFGDVSPIDPQQLILGILLSMPGIFMFLTAIQPLQEELQRLVGKICDRFPCVY